MDIKAKTRTLVKDNYRANVNLADIVIFNSEHKQKSPNDFGFRKLIFSKRKPSDKKKGESIETLMLRMLVGLAVAESKPKTKKEKSLDGKVVEIIESDSESDTAKVNKKFRPNKDHRYSLVDDDFNPYDSSTQSSYSRIMSEYLNNSYNSSYQSKYDSESEERTFRHGDEIMGYHERTKINQKMMMNAMLGKESTDISAEDKQKYEIWKATSKFNQLLSFVLYDKAAGLR